MAIKVTSISPTYNNSDMYDVDFEVTHGSNKLKYTGSVQVPVDINANELAEVLTNRHNKYLPLVKMCIDAGQKVNLSQ